MSKPKRTPVAPSRDAELIDALAARFAALLEVELASGGELPALARLLRREGPLIAIQLALPQVRKMVRLAVDKAVRSVRAGT